VCQTLSKAVQTCFFFYTCSNFVDYSVCLLDCGMMFSESKLTVGCNTLNFCVVSNYVQKKFFEYFFTQFLPSNGRVACLALVA
jgi:hypothetical protein